MPESAALATRWRPRRGERFNFYSHLAGLLLSLVGSCWMLMRTWPDAGMAARAGLLVFLGTLVGVLAASSAVHLSPADCATWRRLDHSMIFALVAGTYTPYVLLTFPSRWWPWLMLTLLWVRAATGIWQQWTDRATATQPVVRAYAVMAWTAVAGAAALTVDLRNPAMAWLLVGAGLYSVGAVFYLNHWGWRHAHGVWHLLVLAGAAAHFVSVAFVLNISTAP